MQKYWAWARSNPVFPWVLVFIIGGLAIPQHGDQLELPRMLTLRAMAEDGTFQIGKYIDWTDEWSRTPDGRYYNNRPPGPVLVPFPVFFVLDKIVQLTEHGKVDDKGRRPWPAHPLRASLSLLFQEIPFGVLVMVAANWLLVTGASLLAVHFFALAALFGNTAALFMNHWSGHGLTACFVLGMVMALVHRRWFWVGFGFGFALLCEYPAAMLLLPLIGAMFVMERRPLVWLKDFMLGGVAPGILWVWYHTVCFGSPFRTSNHFQNPMYLDVKTEGNFLSIMKPWPDMEILPKLLFGAERGLLPTNPWILFAFPLVIWLWAQSRLPGRARLSVERRALILFCVFSQIFMLYMNSSFGGWHAGNTAGPRYMCMLYPIWGLLCALVIDSVPVWARWTLGLLLGVSLVFRGLVFAVNPMIGFVPLWPYLWGQIVHKETLTNWMRLGIYWALLGLAARMVMASLRAGRLASISTRPASKAAAVDSSASK